MHVVRHLILGHRSIDPTAGIDAVDVGGKLAV